MSSNSKSPTARVATLNRDTNETKIQIYLNLDGGPLPTNNTSTASDTTNTTTTTAAAAAASTTTTTSSEDDTVIVPAIAADEEEEEQVSTAHASQSSSAQAIAINTGIGFLDHMFHALSKHSGWSIKLDCQGDLHSMLFFFFFFSFLFTTEQFLLFIYMGGSERKN